MLKNDELKDLGLDFNYELDNNKKALFCKSKAYLFLVLLILSVIPEDKYITRGNIYKLFCFFYSDELNIIDEIDITKVEYALAKLSKSGYIDTGINHNCVINSAPFENELINSLFHGNTNLKKRQKIYRINIKGQTLLGNFL